MSELNFEWTDQYWGDDEDEYGNLYDGRSLFWVFVDELVAEGAEASFFLRAMADVVERDDVNRAEWIRPVVASRIGEAGRFVAAQYRELAAMQHDDPDLGPEGHICLFVPKPDPIDVRRWPALPKSSVSKRRRVIVSRRALCAGLLVGWADHLDAALVSLVSSVDSTGADTAADWIGGLFEEAQEQATAIVSLWLGSRRSQT
jgi:hypothetical protein